MRLSDSAQPYSVRSVTMDHAEPKLSRSASAKAVFPIVGMLGGLLLGTVWAKVSRADELAAVHCVTRWAVTGFFVGLILVVFGALKLGRKDIISVRRLMLLAVIATLLCWYVVKILFDVLGYTSE
jgi:hypothetical protein